MPIHEGPLQVSCARGNACMCMRVCARVSAYGVSMCTGMYVSWTVLSLMLGIGRQGNNSRQT